MECGKKRMHTSVIQMSLSDFRQSTHGVSAMTVNANASSFHRSARRFPNRFGLAFVVCAALALLLVAAPAVAHCDAEDGPVAKDVTKALAKGDIQPILKWISGDDEAELNRVFEQALRVRVAGDDAKAMADRYVLETAVRLHRLSEGAPYTGIKPAGQPLPAPIAAVDRAVEDGEIDSLIADLQEAVDREVRSRFAELQESQAVTSRSVADGRRFVHAYVELVHYVLALHNTLRASHHPGGSTGEGESDHADHVHAASSHAGCNGSH
jgi:hypothetical protein